MDKFQQKNRTQLEQNEVHASITQIYKEYEMIQNGQDVEECHEIKNNKFYQKYDFIEDSSQIIPYVHSMYALKKLTNLGSSIKGLDVGQPWCIYWPLHTIDILDEIPYQEYNKPIVQFLSYCQSDLGGFGGGHMQIPHLAPTYSAILSLLIVGTEQAYELIDRQKLQQFFYSMRNSNYKGSYLMHHNGESDMRAVYIVVIMTILLKLDPLLLQDVEDYIVLCQTYEGGIGAVPYAESHGGYTFCGFASLVAMNRPNRINKTRLLEWLVQRQMEGEGGFNGRTNKVVDSCYSFWMADVFQLLRLCTNDFATYQDQLLLNNQELHSYVKICQDEEGGLFDKPGKSADAYHTCYSLSGMSVTQMKDQQSIKRIDPIYNISSHKLVQAQEYFKNKDIIFLK